MSYLVESSTATITVPNNSSEMVLLMRDMFERMEFIKDKIENNKDLSKEQLSFANIHSQEDRQ